MKRILLLGLALLFVSGAVTAQQVAMYTDETRTSWCAVDCALYTHVYIYLFVGPPAEGAKCVDLNSTHEGGMFMTGTPEWNPDINPAHLGNFPDADLACCFNTCQQDWNWAIKGDLFILGVDPAKFWLRPSQDPLQPNMWMLNCAGVEVEAFALTDFYVNSCGPISVEESSWGAIKSLYE